MAVDEVVFQVVLSLKAPKSGVKVWMLAEQILFRGIGWPGFDMNNPGVFIQADYLLMFTTMVPSENVHRVPVASQ